MNSNNVNPNLTRRVSTGGKRKLSWLWLLAPLAVALLLALNPALSALAAPGDLDPTFSGDGKVTTDFIGHADGASAVAIQPDGKIVAVGYSDVSGNFDNDFALSRYNADGTLDNSFDTDGLVTTDFFGSYDQAYAAAIQPDGKIVAAGSADHGTNADDFALARYNSNGSLDTTFSGNGKVVTDFLGASDDAFALAIQSDGKIVAAGYAAGPSRNYFALARYNPNGSLDTTFGGGVGLVTTDFRVSAGGFGMAIQSDGRIVVAGYVSLGVGNQDFALARYNPNGSLDTTFSGDGEVTTDFFGGDDYAYAMALQSDGKIVAVGYAYHGTTFSFDFALARYNSNGSLDTTFSGNGKVATDFAGLADEANAVAIQSNGKIVAGGVSAVGTFDFALARFTSNGSLDSTFSGDGKVTTDFGGSDYAHALAIQSDGKIVAAGYSGPDFAMARYDSDTPATPTPIAASPTRTNTPLPTTTPLPTHTPLPTQTPGGPTATRTPFPCTIQFTDVLPGSTFYDSVRCMACRGIIDGYPDGTFRPGNNVTRGQLAKIVSNSAGFNDPQGTQLFEDVPVNSTFFDYIGRLASRGYMSGYVCGGPGEPCGGGNLPYFRPSANASRGQISKIVSNAAGFVEPAGTQMFEDVAPGSTFYDFIERLASRGIIGGYQCGSPGEPCGGGNLPYFRPSANASRGQTSKIGANTFFPNCQTPNEP